MREFEEAHLPNSDPHELKLVGVSILMKAQLQNVRGRVGTVEPDTGPVTIVLQLARSAIRLRVMMAA